MPDIKLFHGYMAVVPEVDRPDFAALERRLDEPFVGITADGHVRSGLFNLGDRGAPNHLLVAAAREFLDSLAGDDQRFAALQPLDSVHRRRWTNAFATWLPPGILLDDLAPAQRDAAMRVVAAGMSTAGLAATRNVMKLNEALGEVIGLYRDTLREWVYFFAIFGNPSEHEPWGWQLMGHHLVLNCFVLGEQVIVSPVFMGAEMVELDEGRFVGIKAFADEHERGLGMIRSLSGPQQDRAILYHSMRSADLPLELSGRVDGRHRGGAGRDNLVLPFEGVRADELNGAQRERLVALIETYLARGAHGEADLARAKRHLDETFFAWIGDPAEDGPFYYRVHSPVILIEFDHHPGIFITAEEPQPFHVHTIVRMPNAGDYGMALLAQYREHLIPS